LIAAIAAGAAMSWTPSASAQSAPDLDCVFKGTCSKPPPAPRPKPPAPRPKPPPVAPHNEDQTGTRPPATTPAGPTSADHTPPGPGVPGKDDTAGPGTTPPAPPPGPPPVPPAVTERLQELAQGDPQDVLLFFNETSDAPNGARNPQGQVTFRDGRVAPCAALGWTGGPDVSAGVRAVLERYGATRVVTEVASTSCPEGRRPYDIVAVERRLFQALPPDVTRSLVTDIVEKRLTPLGNVTGSDIAAARERLKREREVTAGLRDGTLKGMGLLLLGGTPGRVCAVGVDDEARPAVAAAVQGWRASLPPRLGQGGVDVAAFDKNEVLAAARRGECGAIFGDAATLRDIEATLRSDTLPATVAGVWMTPPEWEALLDRLGVPRTTADRRRLLTPKINPLAERLMADLKAYADADGKSGVAGTQFPAFAQWYGNLKAATWSPTPESFTIDDYGSTPTDGSTPVVSIIVYFTLTAPSAGKTERNCMVFAWRDDSASGNRLDPTAFSCDAIPDLESWKRQRGMKSRWN
jgi:hypothetical protein